MHGHPPVPPRWLLSRGRRLVCSGEPSRGRRPWWTEGRAARQAPSPWSVALGLGPGALRVLGASRASGWSGPPPIQAGATMDQEDCSGAGGQTTDATLRTGPCEVANRFLSMT
jgi:hypothetical protein